MNASLTRDVNLLFNNSITLTSWHEQQRVYLDSAVCGHFQPLNLASVQRIFTKTQLTSRNVPSVFIHWTAAKAGIQRIEERAIIQPIT